VKNSVYESGGKTTVAGEFCDGLVTGLSQRDQQEGEILKAREIRHRLLADPNNPALHTSTDLGGWGFKSLRARHCSSPV
jgi:hypothetical protein